MSTGIILCSFISFVSATTAYLASKRSRANYGLELKLG
jgi:hypothetical protein